MDSFSNISEQLSALLQSLPEPTFIVSNDGVLLRANTALFALLGGDQQSIEGGAVVHIWPQAESAKVQFESSRNERREQLGVEFSSELRSLSGDTIAVKLSCLTPQSDGVLIVRVLAGFSESEVGKIFHSQRLETLGFLAGSVAHDFNNVLTGILGHVAYLNSVLPKNGAHLESLQSIEEGALRAAGITQQIVNFSKLQTEEQLSGVDLNDVTARVCALVKGAIPSGVQLVFRKAQGSVTLLSTEARLTQVLINLIVNARDALTSFAGTDGGIISVSIAEKCASEDVLSIFGPEPPSQSYCVLTVADDGMGMTEEVKTRLFEPYFTTKKDGGTGLGLATVHSIVRGLGGAIIFESELSHGTTFRVVLPLMQEGVGKGESQSGEPLIEGDESGPVRGNGEKILVIDDEYAVRNVLGLTLSHLGYDPDTAATGLEGLEKYQSVVGSYDLVVLDLLMPGLSGEEVFERIKRLNPDQKILIVSGFSSEGVVRRLLSSGAAGFIQKPFSIDSLAAKVKGCL